MSVPYRSITSDLVIGQDPLAFQLPDPNGAHARALQSWRNFGFGIFIHWGVNCRTSHEISYSRGRQQSATEYDDMASILKTVTHNAGRNFLKMLTRAMLL